MARVRGTDSGALIHQLGRLFGHGTSIGLTEGELLERFVSGHDESAFETLVARHGPMVLGICRQLLQDPNDVDDAFQATFLVLVRKAGTLRRRDLLGNWLYGVAHRVATRARTSSARRTARVVHDPRSALTLDVQAGGSGISQALDWDPDPWPGLHREISHLPEKYRVPIVLCYFEGLTHDEVATRLGWPLGSVKGRLARARDLLRRRLSRHGVGYSPAALASYLKTSDVQMAVPSYLAAAASRAAQLVIGNAGTSLVLGSSVSIPVSALVEGVLQTIMINQMRAFAFSALCAAGIVTTGVVWAASQRPDSGSSSVTNGSAPASGASLESPFKGALIAEQQPQRREQPQSPQPSQQPSKESAIAASNEMIDQIRSEIAAFDKLWSGLRDPDIGDIDRLNRWSLLTLDADLVLAKTEADQKAAYQAHRDRIKRLVELVEKLPVSPQNRPVKSSQAHALLDQAESLFENRASGGMMSSMAGRMGGRGMMGMTGMAATGGMAGQVSAQQKMMNMMQGQMMKPTMGGASSNQPAGTVKKNRRGGMFPIAGQGMMRGKDVRSPRTKSAPAPEESVADELSPAGPGAGMMMSGTAGGRMGAGSMGGPAGMMGRAMGGPLTGMPSSSAAAAKLQLHRAVAAGIAEMEKRDSNPRNKAILKRLDEPIAMPFAEDTPLEDVVKYIRVATTSKTKQGIPIYVEPEALQEIGVTMTSTISNLDLEGIPLKTTLRLLLQQLGLAYCVRDGVLIISSHQGIIDELSQARITLDTEQEFEGGTRERAEGASEKVPSQEPDETPKPAPAGTPEATPSEEPAETPK